MKGFFLLFRKFFSLWDLQGSSGMAGHICRSRWFSGLFGKPETTLSSTKRLLRRVLCEVRATTCCLEMVVKNIWLPSFVPFGPSS
jgi:hypothetical protein